MVEFCMPKNCPAGKVGEWLWLNRFNLLKLPAVAIGVWFVISSDGKVIPWRAAIVGSLFLFVYVIGPIRGFLRRRRSRKNGAASASSSD
jgi:hypothetical protein